MPKPSLTRISSICVLLFVLPLPAFAIFDFGGWVLNVPTSGGAVGRAAAAASASSGTTVVYPPCLNGVEEVNVKSPPLGMQSPPALLQFIGAYTFSYGPARLIGQRVLGKYLPTPMPCIATFLILTPCPPAVCVIPTPLPLFFAPLILFNGSSLR